MMAATSSRTRSSGPVHGYPRPSFSSASAFASSSSSFSAPRGPAPAFVFPGHGRAASPTRVRLAGASSASVRFSLADRPTSPGRSLSVSSRDHQIVKRPIAAPPAAAASRRRTCMCSPTTHPGSFRCALHKKAALRPGGSPAVTPPSSRLNARRSAMTNSLVRIGTVEGSDLIRRALAALIRPSSHQQRRRAAFHPRPSRLSMMSKADDLC